jgi:hypothetical protein
MRTGLIDTGVGGGDPDVDLDEFGPDTDDTDIQSPDEEIEDAIGGGAYPDAGISIGINDEGRVTESITTGTGGPGSTNYGGPDVAADPDTDPVGTVESDESRETLEKVEQALEEVTGGTAFGDPDEVEDIGSGEAVTEPLKDSAPGGTGPGGIPWALVGVLGLVGVGAYAYKSKK